jgi:glycosyltransferase involved in cell wall biosynthesis
MLPSVAFCNAVIACSDACLASLPMITRALAVHKISVIHNCADTGRVRRVLAEHGGSPHDRTGLSVISVGRLIDIKDPLLLLDAFARVCCKGDRLTYLGEGDLRQEIDRAARQAGIQDQISMSGLVPRDDVYRGVARSGLFVSTSKGEGLPLAVLEVMACGCPVILSDIGPHREIVGDETFIPLVSPGDVEGFVREIARFQAMSPDEAAAIGKRCRDLVERRFSFKTLHDKHEALYRRLAGLIAKYPRAEARERNPATAQSA